MRYLYRSMIKNKIAIMAFVLCIQTAYADVAVEGTVSAFLPTSHIVKTIYGKAWQQYGLVFNHVSEAVPKRFPPVTLFGQVNYLFAHGYSENGNQRTTIKVVPVTLGAKWFCSVHHNIDIYLAAAPRYYFMKIANNSTYVPAEQKESSFGGYGTFGVFFHPVDNFVIDLFVAYSAVTFQAQASTPTYIGFATKVAGVDLGAGIGFTF